MNVLPWIILFLSPLIMVFNLGDSYLNLQRMAGFHDQRTEVEDLRRMLKLSLASEPFCRCNFANRNLVISPTVQSIGIPSLGAYVGNAGAACGSFAQPQWLASGNMGENLYIQSISFDDIRAIPGADRYYSTLKVNVSARGIALRTIEIPDVVLLANSGAVSGCRYDGDKTFAGNRLLSFTPDGPGTVPYLHQDVAPSCSSAGGCGAPITNSAAVRSTYWSMSLAQRNAATQAAPVIKEYRQSLQNYPLANFVNVRATCTASGRNNESAVTVGFFKGSTPILGTTACHIMGWSDKVEETAKITLDSFIQIPYGADSIEIRSELSAGNNSGHSQSATESIFFVYQ